MEGFSVSSVALWQTVMLTIHKRYIVNDQGTPTDVIIDYQEFRQIEELLGLDLDEDAVADLWTARQDREAGKPDAYVALDDI